jgi:signal transduction histidine kinase
VRPRTLFGQILIATLVAIVAAQALAAWLLLDDRSRFAARLWGAHTAQRVAGLVDAVDQAGPGERARLVRALNFAPMRVTLDEPWLAGAAAPIAEVPGFAAELRRALARPLEVQVVAPPPERGAGGAPERAEAPEPGEPHHAHRPGLRVLVQARLSDGSVLTIRHAAPAPPSEQPFRLLGWIVVLIAIVAALSAWIVRKLTRPLAVFAGAATGLARNLDQPPLSEQGPAEIAAAARAFNRMQRDLRQTLEARAQTLAAVSHDLRLPITRLRLRIEKIADAAVREAIEADLVEMDRMIGDTLEFLRAGRGDEPPVRLDVNALVEGLIEDMQAIGCRVELHGAAEAPLLARGQPLRRCLGNLLDNACRYGGGAVDLTVRDESARIEFAVEDRGPGIPEAERERVFEPFVRLEASRAKHTGGTGLGLAIARAVARRHGGDVSLQQRPGGGLRAVLVLPREAAPVPGEHRA